MWHKEQVQHLWGSHLPSPIRQPLPARTWEVPYNIWVNKCIACFSVANMYSSTEIFTSFIFLKTAIVFQIHCYTWLHQNAWISWDPAQEEFIYLTSWSLCQWHVLISVMFSLTLKTIVSSCRFGSGIRFSQPWEMCGFAFASWLFICCCCYFFLLKKGQTVPSQLKQYRLEWLQ